MEARINKPSTLGGNWLWRMDADMLSGEALEKIYRLTRISSRLSEEKQQEEAKKLEEMKAREAELKKKQEESESKKKSKAKVVKPAEKTADKEKLS